LQGQRPDGQDAQAPAQAGDVPDPRFADGRIPATQPDERTRTGAGGGLASENPITGEGFREWTDRMRDVEEMVNDPALRAQAAAIRERMAELRAQAKRDEQAPSWKVVDENVAKPLAQLRDAISSELLRRESADARVPIDKEPVPAAYAEEVRQYYERLGSGK
jgi:hypothetical protein